MGMICDIYAGESEWKQKNRRRDEDQQQKATKEETTTRHTANETKTGGNHDQAYGERNEDEEETATRHTANETKTRGKPRPGIRRTKRRRGRNRDKAYGERNEDEEETTTRHTANETKTRGDHDQAYGERNEDEGKPTGDIAMGWLPFDRLTWRCEGFLTGFSTGEPSHRLGEVVTKPAFLRRLTCVAVAFRMIEEETSSIGYCQQLLITLCTNTMTPQGYASIVIQEWQSCSVTLTYFETVLYG